MNVHVLNTEIKIFVQRKICSFAQGVVFRGNSIWAWWFATQIYTTLLLTIT